MSPVRSLADKLKLKPGMRSVVLASPEGYLESLGVIQVGTVLSTESDWIQLFCFNKEDLAAQFPLVKAALAPNALLWICFQKGKAGKAGGLTRDSGWEPVKGLKWVTLVSVNDHWSAFCLRPLKTGEAENDWR